MRRHSSRGIASLLAALSAALILAATPVAAISDVSQGGNYGQWLANDSLNAAGAKCTYNDNYRLTSINARAPIVYSYRSGGQIVGWRLRIVHRHLIPGNDQYTEETVFTSKFQKDFATLSHAADFTRKTWTRDISMVSSSRFRVYVVIRWYKPSDGSVEGTASFRYDWLRQVGPGVDNTQQIYFCYRAPY
jgi:hypothetical protein